MTTAEATTVIAAILNHNEQGIPDSVWPLIKDAGCCSPKHEWEAYMERRTTKLPRELYLEETVGKLMDYGRNWNWAAADNAFGMLYGMLGAKKPEGNNGLMWHRGEHPVQQAL